ncbi:MAG: hypothetical protein KGI33_02150 [Thaumarchaeota archaeon]|nr:hypothetical protein [Nitrososphaerota archaeon]
MKEFGTLEYVLDTYSKNWTWKLTGSRAVSMVARVIPQAWYGDGPEEAMVPDTVQNVEKIKWIMETYPLEIKSRNIWQRKTRHMKVPKRRWTKIEKLRKATPGGQFRGTLLNFQREGLDFLLKSSGNALLADEMGLGKCVLPDTLISTLNGQVTIKEIWDKGEVTEKDNHEEWASLKKPIKVQSFNGRRVVTKEVTRVFRQKIDEDIMKITFADGASIECTKRHRLCTPEGWKMAGRLTMNDMVAIPAKTLHQGKSILSPEAAELMAWQVAEENEYHEEKKYARSAFSNSDYSALTRVQKLAKQNGNEIPNPGPRANNPTNFVSGTSGTYKEFSKFRHEWTKKSKDKDIQRAILEAPIETQKAFVQALFDAGGHVRKSQCEFTTASKSIALSLREILLHFGVWLRIREARKFATNGSKIRRKGYVCTIDANSVSRFHSEFRPLAIHKQKALDLLAAENHGKNIDHFPLQETTQKITEDGMPMRSLRLFTPHDQSQWMCKEISASGRAKMEPLHMHEIPWGLHGISSDSINWCPVKSLKVKHHAGYVYDLSVPETHNYIANGIITHNTIMTLAYLATEKQTFPALIVAPLVTLTNWEREAQKFLKKRSKNGRILEAQFPSSILIRTGKSQEIERHDVYIINYDLLYKRLGDLSKLGIRTIVCDEVQHLRSKSTKKYSAVKKLAALESVKYRIGLSGTPIYNRGSEIWPIVDILRPGLLGSFEEFCEYFCYVNEKGKAIVLENKRASLGDELRKHVMLRRKKSDVLKELKEKVRYKEFIDSDINYYHSELDKIWKRLEEEQKNATSAFDKFSSYKRAIQSERQAAGAAKLPHVIEFVKNIMEIEESVVVFCHHKAIHALLHKSLQEFSPSSIIGGQSDKERQNNIERFQNGQTKLMIAGLRAGNVGINLSVARYVIFAELDWSPAIHRQAEDRCIKQGQLVNVQNKGLIEIENVKLNDLVLTHLGNWKKVQNIKRREHRGLMTEITYHRYSKPLICTHDHRILVLKQDQAKPKWINADEILPGDFVLTPVPTKILDKTTVDMPEECFHNPTRKNQLGSVLTDGRYIQIQRRTELDDDLLCLFGLYTAEGFSGKTDGKGSFISLPGHVREMPVLEKLGERLGKLGATYSIECNEGNAELRAYSAGLATWFSKWFGGNAHEKRIPEFILDLPAQKLKIFFGAYCKGEDNLRDSRQEWVTDSRQLASQINLIALKCGFMPSLMEIENGKEGGQWIGGYAINGDPGDKKHDVKDNEYCYQPVKDVRTYHDRATVYDLTVEDDHSFVVGQASVHNCHRIGQKNTVFAYYLIGNGTLDDHVANVLVDKSYEIDAIMDEKEEAFENKDKAELILAQIHDRLTTKH